MGGACALYGGAYLRPYADERSVGAPLAGYNLLLASMTVVCLADNLLLFLVAWELMTLSSYALVVQEHALESVREAGRQYLIAAHLATAALLLLVLLLSAGSGSLELSGLSPDTAAAPATLLFLLALAGFGTKAGIVPFHVWLPDAHPAAPSHVSALMSAVMITMGFYGLARFIPLLGPPPLWWGLVLMALGAAGALSGIAFALAQRDVKRILAYSTIENAGIIALAFGVGLLGTTLDRPALAALGWLGGLLHLWNHALFKSVLFLGYGAAAQRVQSRDAEAMGGLLRRWPMMGGLMVLSAAAIAALPGLNGFTGEWVILYGLLTGGAELRGAPQIALLAGVPALALTGALTAACFARLTGVALLGEPRSDGARRATAPDWEMWLPMLLLAALCVAVAWAPAQVVALLAPAVAGVAPRGDMRAVAGRGGAARGTSPCWSPSGSRSAPPSGGCSVRRAAGVSPGPDLGVRLRSAGVADAVHRVVLRGADHADLPAAPPEPSRERRPGRGRLARGRELAVGHPRPGDGRALRAGVQISRASTAPARGGCSVAGCRPTCSTSC